MTGTDGILYVYTTAAGRITAWTMRPVFTGEHAGHINADLAGTFAGYWVDAKPTEVVVALTLPESGVVQSFRATVGELTRTSARLVHLVREDA